MPATSEPVGGTAGQPQVPPAPVDPAVQQQFDQALAHFKAGNLDQAKAGFQTLHSAQPQLSGPIVNLGIIARNQGDNEAAKTWFDKALSVNPRNLEAMNLLGVMAREAGEFEAAEAHYRKALSIDPGYAPAHLNLGILLELYRGKLAEALEHFEKYQSLQSEPDKQVERWIADLRLRTQ